MARYIDADRLIAEYDRVHVGPAGGARKLMVDAPTADVVPRVEAENYKSIAETQQKLSIERYFEIKQLKQELDKAKGKVEYLQSELDVYEFIYDIASDKQKLDEAKAEVARAFRKRMNEKMGKHTHLLGKEYVQRIMREVEKEYTEGEK